MTFSVTRRTGLGLSLAMATSLLTGFALPAQADMLDDITKAGVIRVGIFEDFPPFASLNASMKVEGYDTEVADKLAAALGVDDDDGAQHHSNHRTRFARNVYQETAD